MQMYLRQSYFILFWVTQCLVEYGFASLPWDACEGNSHPSLALTTIQCGCQISPLPSCSEHFSFPIRVKKTTEGSVSAAHVKWQNSQLHQETRKTRSPRAWQWVHALPPRHSAHKKKKRGEVSSPIFRSVGSGRGKGRRIVLRNRKSLKAAAAVTQSSLRYLCSSI